MRSRKQTIAVGLAIVFIGIALTGVTIYVVTNPLSLGNPLTGYTIGGQSAGLYLGGSGTTINLQTGTQYSVIITWTGTQTYNLWMNNGTWYNLGASVSSPYTWFITPQTGWVSLQLRSATDLTTGLPQSI